MPAGVGLSLVAAPLVALAFGAGWEPAVPVLRILSLSFTIMVFGHLSLHLLSAHALLGRLVGITLVGAVARVALLALLIPAFGLTGAAIGRRDRGGAGAGADGCHARCAGSTSASGR